jgi:hypothetical protein
MKIYRISTIITSKGVEQKVIEWGAEEKKLTYSLTRVDEWGETLKKQFKKEALHRITDGRFYNSLRMVEFVAYCFENEIDEWKGATKRSAIKFIRQQKSDLDSLLNHVSEEDLKNA